MEVILICTVFRNYLCLLHFHSFTFYLYSNNLLVTSNLRSLKELRGLSPRANYSGRHLMAKLVPSFPDRECHVVSLTDPYGRILSFLDRSRYFFFQVAS
jgi:hypothetical protein